MSAHLEDEIFTGRFDFALWRRVLAFARPYKRLLASIVVLGWCVAVFDVTFPLITGSLIDHLRINQETGAPARIGTHLLVYGGVVVLFTICIFAFINFCGSITTGVSHDIRRAAFEKLQELPFSFYDRKAVGWLMARLTSDCSSLSRVMAWALLDIAWGSFVITLVSIAMFWINWRVAIVVVLIVPPLAFVCRYFQVRLLISNRALRKANSQTTASFNEGMLGVRTTKSMGREEKNLGEFSHLADTMYNHAVTAGLYEAMFLPLVQSLCAVGVGLALWRGGLQVMIGGMTLGKLVAFVQYATFLAQPAQELAHALTMAQGAQASAERVQTLLDTDPEIVDSSAVRELIAQHAPREGFAADGLSARIGKIEFRDVTFAYKQGQTVLSDFNLTVYAGQTIALVGATGGGKSTIVGLACRFYEPTTGSVLIDGVDYRQRSLKWLQSSLGMVLQQPHLFSGTVRDNIRYGRLEATDAEVEEAARLTNAHEFIAALEKGYDTQVGESGNKLSTGQKQLIALARAIIADPQVFVMDEATSSVDTQTERAIQSAVERVLEGRISFVIAHRLSTIKSADRILVIDAGRIVEEGTHHDLLAQRGRYFELYTNQFTHEHEEEVLLVEATK